MNEEEQSGGSVQIQQAQETPEPDVSTQLAETEQQSQQTSAPARDEFTFGLDPELLASLEEDEEQTEAPPVPQEALAATEEELKEDPPTTPVATAEPVKTEEAPVQREGYPSLQPAPGRDIWGNVLQDGVPVMILKDENGRPVVYEADPQTGLIKLDEADIEDFKKTDPDGYLAYRQEAQNRINRLGEVLHESQAKEVEQVRSSVVANGMPAPLYEKIHAKADELIKKAGVQGLTPGAYAQAVIGATSEMLLYDKENQVEIARAIIAAHEAEAGQKPAAEPAKTAPAPQPQRPIRLAAGGISSVSSPPPAKTVAPAPSASVPPDVLAELNRIGLSVEDYLQYGELSVN